MIFNMLILKIKKIKKIILIYFYKISCITIPNKKKEEEEEITPPRTQKELDNGLQGIPITNSVFHEFN